MKFYKYLFLLISLLITSQVFALCPHPAEFPGRTNLNPPPTTICAPFHAGGFCKLKVDWVGPPINTPCTNPEGCSPGPSYSLGLSSMSDRVYRNSDCTVELQDGCTQLPNGNIECEEEEEEEENDPILQCSTDSCPNPDNKRCPTGYVRGSYNGQNLCVKSRTDDECDDPNGCDEPESEDEIIAAIDRANNDITDSNNTINDTLNQGFENIKNALNAILDKIGQLSDSIAGLGNNNGGSENQNQQPDTSGFNADLPVEDEEIQNLDKGLYTTNDQCPAKKIINLPQYGLHHEFDFTEICNTLYLFGYLVLIFSYVIAARIVTKA